MRTASPLVQGATVFRSSPKAFPQVLNSRRKTVMASLKRVVVTGGNKGIGFSNIEAMLARGDTYAIMGSRDLGRGNAAKEELLKINQNWADKLEVLEVDVASDSSVAAAAASLLSRFGHGCLYGLVNNAGIYGTDGNSRETIDVNVFGVKRCIEAFAPLIAPGGRIVNVSSGAGPMHVGKCSEARQAWYKAPHSWEEIAAGIAEFLAAEDEAKGGDAPSAALVKAGFPPLDLAGMSGAYGFSKAILNNYTALLAATLPVQVNACSPGFIITDLTKKMVPQLGGATLEQAGALPAEKSVVPISFLLYGDVAGAAPNAKVPGSGLYYGSDAKRSPVHKYRSANSEPYDGSED